MKVLFDHCVARPLRKELPQHEIKTTVDEELRQYFSDMLFSVKLKQGGEAFIYILLESLLGAPRERVDRRGGKAYFSAQFQISLLSHVELRPSSFVVRDQWQ